MWFLGCLLGLALLSILASAAGSLVFPLLTGHRPLSIEDRLALLPIGTGALMVTTGCASYLGVQTRIAGPALCAAVLLGVAIRAFAGRGSRRAPAGGFPGTALFAAAAVLAAGWIIALLPVLRFNAFNPFGDTITYISIADYLQFHDFRRAVTVDHPMLMQPLIYRAQYFRMGANFLLAFIQSILPVSRSIEVYPIATAWGFGLNLVAVAIAARWALVLERGWARGAMLLAASAFGPLLYSVKAGFYPQLIGIPFSMLFCVATARALRGGWRTRRQILLPALFLGCLTSGYSELVPVCAIAGAALFALRALGRPRLAASALGRIALSGAAYALVGNFEIVRMVRSLPTQIRAIVGWNVTFSHLQYLEHALGLVSDNSDVDPWAPLGRAGAVVPLLLTGFLAAVLAWGAARLWRSPRRGPLLQWLACLAVFAVLYLYFSTLVANPWEHGVTGQSWSKFKIAQWSSPFLLLALVAAASSFRRARTGFALLLALFAAALAPAHWQSAKRTTASIRQLAADPVRPYAAYPALVAFVQRNYPSGAVQLSFPDLGDYMQAAQAKMLVYYFYPRPVVGHWNSVLSFASYSEERLNAQAGEPAITLAPAAGTRGLKLPAGMIVRRPDSFLDLAYSRDWYPAETFADEQWRWSAGSSTISITAPREETVSVRGEYVCATAGKLTISSGAASAEFECSTVPWRNAWRLDGVKLAPGANEVRFRMDGGAVFLGSDPRKLSFRVVNVKVESGAPEAAACAAP